ncbi:MAG: hypothetical protein KC621_06255 [Myxococcales bacterium]|nr:hypothetical protein [Myxococcales bacterium]
MHAVARSIDQDPGAHRDAFLRLWRTHGRIMRFLERAELGTPDATGLARYLAATSIRVFQTVGRSRAPTRAELDAAQRRVTADLPRVLPLGPDLTDAARSVDRAQPHLLDELLDTLFVWPGPSVADDREKVRIYVALWAVVEALDHAWTPPRSFRGEDTYVRVHLPPPPIEDQPEPEDIHVV